MTIVGLIIGLALLLLALWLVQTFLPAPWKTPLLVILVLIGVIWILSFLWPGLAHVRVG